jgi:hypothetical protein
MYDDGKIATDQGAGKKAWLAACGGMTVNGSRD